MTNDLAERMTKERAELELLDKLHEAAQRYKKTAVIDDDFLLIRHEYYGTLHAYIALLKKNIEVVG